MKNYQYVLFDLDGTLTDSGEGITNSVEYALKKFNIEVSDKKELNRFIGPPLGESFKSFYGFSEEKSETAIEYYREYFKEKGIFENSVYDGVEQLLKILKENCKTIIVATSKPEIFARQIIAHFNLSQYFTYVAGANLNSTRTKKDEVIKYALEENNIVDLSKVVMVGDKEHDVIGAKKCGIDVIGVLFGYGSRKELEAAGATYIAKTVGDIWGIIGG